MATHVEENYLKAIYTIGLKAQKGVSTKDIATRLEATPPSVSDMLKKLKTKGWINYEKYQGASLTNEGKKIAVEVVRKHRLWEVFLVDKLNFRWDEVHELAEQLEHIRSVELTNRLDAFLDNPRVDPHGDPIPDADGTFHIDESSIPLAQAEELQPLVIVGVKDSSSEFLQYLDTTGLVLGGKITVKQTYAFDQSLLISMSDKQAQVSAQVAKNLIVKPV